MRHNPNECEDSGCDVCRAAPSEISKIAQALKDGTFRGGSDDPVNHPSHYTQHSMECIDVLRVVLTPEEFRGFCLGNALKYRWRRGDKGNAEQDMAKAQWYLDRLTQNPK